MRSLTEIIGGIFKRCREPERLERFERDHHDHDPISRERLKEILSPYKSCSVSGMGAIDKNFKKFDCSWESGLDFYNNLSVGMSYDTIFDISENRISIYKFVRDNKNGINIRFGILKHFIRSHIKNYHVEIIET